MTEHDKPTADETAVHIARIAGEFHAAFQAGGGKLPLRDYQVRVASILREVSKIPMRPAAQIVEYDPKTCITAGELRSVGVAVPENVPDCGWVPRWAWTFEVMPSDQQLAPTSPDAISLDVAHRFSEPFRWINVELTAERAAP